MEAAIIIQTDVKVFLKSCCFVFAGLNWAGTDHGHIYLSGQPVTFTNWAPDQPYYERSHIVSTCIIFFKGFFFQKPHYSYAPTLLHLKCTIHAEDKHLVLNIF